MEDTTNPPFKIHLFLELRWGVAMATGQHRRPSKPARFSDGSAGTPWLAGRLREPPLGRTVTSDPPSFAPRRLASPQTRAPGSRPWQRGAHPRTLVLKPGAGWPCRHCRG